MKAVLAFVAASCLAFSIHASPITITVPETKSVKLTAEDYRLDKFVVPSNYKIILNLETGFETTNKFLLESSEITFTVTQNTKEIRIHYALDHTSETTVKVNSDDGLDIPASIAAPNLETEISVITLTEELIPGKLYTMVFTNLVGTLRDNMSGFYLSKYNHDGIDKFIATTQFQATDARAAFPCFDEPSFKATFDITIKRPNEYTTVLANTKRIGNDVVVGAYTTTTFDTTPKMSTYLVAFIVSTLESIPDPNYAVFFPEGMKPTAEYAFRKTPEIIADLGNKLLIKYPDLGNPQLYQAAIPDFSAGAMENWGLATYRETALLWDPIESTAKNQQRVCSVIAHEISHMWFGDYVTMEWWSDAWLNEGFARYFEYHTTANVETDFDMRNQFVIEQQQVIFNADAVSTSLPLSSKPEDIYTPNQVNSKFGTITYNKGGSVLRMIERTMTEETFLAALNEYLVENKEGNTLYSQLLSKFEAKGLKPGSMVNWITESGYPVVTVKKDGDHILLSQKRFLVDGKVSTTKWTIPITYASNIHNKDYSKTTADAWMEQNVESTKIENALKDTDIVVLNVQGSGYYRVNYERDLWERITTQLKTATKGGIIELNRAILIDDVMNMARVELQSYDTALDLTKYLSAEVDYYPWVAAFNAFAFLNKRIESAEVSAWFKNYVMRMSTKLIEEASFDNEIISKAKHIEILKTVLALQWACDLGVQSCLTKSKELFTQYLEQKNENPINANLRSVVYCNGIRQGAKDEWDFLFAKYVTSPAASEKVTIMSALGCSKDKVTVETFLTKSISDIETGIRRQDAYSVFTSVVNGNPQNLDIALDFLIKNFVKIAEKYPSTNALSNIFIALADRFTTTAQFNSFKAFLEANTGNLGEAEEVGKSALVTAEANMAWTGKFQANIRSWLSRERGDKDGAVHTTAASVLIAIMAFFVTYYH